MEKWFLANKKADFAQIGMRFKISPITAKIIRNRDIVDDAAIEKFLYGKLEDLHDPLIMKDMELLVSILTADIKQGRKIRVVQDYDVDGCMSGYILVTAIKACGGTADYDVPDRTTEGYGINKRIVDCAVNDGIDTILTCDNGIAAIDEIEYARKKGLRVIVTDHHEVQYTEENGKKSFILPKADAIVDPKQPECTYPFKQLCGAGIAYKVAQLLFEAFNKTGYENLLQYAAVATICDIVDLTDENRIIVKEGFRVLENTTDFGMRALLDRCLRRGDRLTVGRVGFFIGPVINAGGRMSTAQMVMNLLFSGSQEEAENILNSLVELNEERKRETERAVREIMGGEIPKGDVIIAYCPSCHESVAGIAAGRIKDRYYRPTIVLTDSGEDEYIKGSARSVEGFDIFERLLTVRDLLSRFGGHPMAAGMTLKRKDLDEFIRRVNEPGWPESAERFKRITIDAAVMLSAISKDVINELELIEPCGKGNRSPIFAAKHLKVSSMRIMGAKRNAVKMVLSDETARLEGIWFGDADQLLENIREAHGSLECEKLLKGMGEIYMDIIYTPRINTYNGNERIQLDISSIRWES